MRLGAVLALRPQKRPAIATVRDDQDPAVAWEAARTINDRRITAALPARAAQGAGSTSRFTGENAELALCQDGIIKVNKSDVANREKGLRGMPAGFSEVISRQEMGTLIAFLTARN